MSASDWINPYILQKFRERMNLRPEEVAQQAQKLIRYQFAPISEQQLRGWEQGSSSPSLEHLETLSEIYQCPVGYFFLDELPANYHLLSYRGLAPEKENKLSPLTQQAINRFLALSDWIVYLIEVYGIKWEVKIKQQKNFETEELVKQETQRLGFSEQVRRQWNTTEESYNWWRSQIEAQGIFSFEMRLDPSEVRGASRWVNSRYPFILVNHEDTEAATGRIFTLLHKYAHLLTTNETIACDFRGRESGQGLEPAANRFAARMLVPIDKFQEQLMKWGKLRFQQTWSDDDLNTLREPFFVSRDVVAITLQELKLAPDDFYLQKRKQWERRKPWGKGGAKKPLTKNERKAREIGNSALYVLLSLNSRQKLPILDAAYALDMKVEKTSDFLSWASQIKPFDE